MVEANVRQPAMRANALSNAPPHLLLFGAFTIVSVMNYGFNVVMAWLLRPHDYGLLAFSQTALLIAGLVLQSGIPWSLTRAVVGKSSQEVSAAVRGAIVSNVGLGIALSALILLLFHTGVLQTGFERNSLVLLVALPLPLFALIAVSRATAQGVEQFGVSAAINVIEVFAKLLAGVAFVAAGLRAPGAVAGFSIGALVAAFVSVTYLRRRIGTVRSRDVVFPSTATIGPMFGALLGLALLLNQDLIAVKLLSQESSVSAGYYQAATVLANAPYFLVVSAIIPVLYTRLARFASLLQMRRAVLPVFRSVLVLVVPFEIVMAIYPEVIMNVFFPASYTPAASQLRLLAIGNTLAIGVAVLSAAFQAVGKPEIPAKALIGVTAVEAIVLWIVVPSAGGDGAAAVFALASLVALVGLAVGLVRGAETDLWHAAPRFLTKYLAVVLLSGASLWLGTAIGANTYLALGFSAFTYVVATHLTGLLPDALRAFVSGALRAPQPAESS